MFLGPNWSIIIYTYYIVHIYIHVYITRHFLPRNIQLTYPYPSFTKPPTHTCLKRVVSFFRFTWWAGAKSRFFRNQGKGTQAEDPTWEVWRKVWLQINWEIPSLKPVSSRLKIRPKTPQSRKPDRLPVPSHFQMRAVFVSCRWRDVKAKMDVFRK